MFKNIYKFLIKVLLYILVTPFVVTMILKETLDNLEGN